MNTIAQNDLVISRMKLTNDKVPEDSYLFPMASAVSMSNKKGINITVTRMSDDAESWKVSGAGLDGTITSVVKGELTAWNYVSGTDTIKINSTCTIYRDWYKYFSWNITDGKQTAGIVCDEPDCMSHYSWLMNADSVGCEVWGRDPKGSYIEYSKDGKGSECVATDWRIKNQKPLPATYSNKMRFAAAFMASISLTLRETERKKSQ